MVKQHPTYLLANARSDLLHILVVCSRYRQDRQDTIHDLQHTDIRPFNQSNLLPTWSSVACELRCPRLLWMLLLDVWTPLNFFLYFIEERNAAEYGKYFTKNSGQLPSRSRWTHEATQTASQLRKNYVTRLRPNCRWVKLRWLPHMKRCFSQACFEPYMTIGLLCTSAAMIPD